MAVKIAESLEPEVTEMKIFVEKPVVKRELIDTFWGQVEQSLQMEKKLLENQEEVYMNGMKEMLNFNKQYRKSMIGLFHQTRHTNNDLVKGLMSYLTPGKANEQAESNELLIQVEEVYNVFEKTVLTPIENMFEMIDALEENIEKGAVSYVSYTRNTRQVWEQMTSEYVKTVKNTTNKFIERI